MEYKTEDKEILERFKEIHDRAIRGSRSASTLPVAMFYKICFIELLRDIS